MFNICLLFRTLVFIINSTYCYMLFIHYYDVNRCFCCRKLITNVLTKSHEDMAPLRGGTV